MAGRRGIPRRPIFWTLDQIADMLALSELTLRKSYVWFDGKEVGVYRKHFLLAVNLAKTAIVGATNASQWRVAEDEFLRWLTYHKLWIIDNNSVYPVPLQTLAPGHLTYSEQSITVVDIINPSTEEA